MAQVYPGTLNTFSNPAGTNTLPGTEASGLPHATQHADLNDAVESHEAVLGTNAGTSVLKHFAAGEFPVRATGVAAVGTLQQTLVGGSVSGLTGTINNPVIGTPAITGGTSTAMKVVGTDILSNAGLFGTTGIQFTEGTTLGSFQNTTYNNGTNIGSISFTPLVNIKPLIMANVTWDSSAGTATLRANLSINGSTFGSAGGGGDFLIHDFNAPVISITIPDAKIFLGPTLTANTAATVIVPTRLTAAGTMRVFYSNLIILPFPAT